MLGIIDSILKFGLEFMFFSTLMVIYLGQYKKKSYISALLNGMIWGTLAAFSLYFIKKYLARIEFIDVLEKGFLFLGVLSLGWILFGLMRNKETAARPILFLFGFVFSLEPIQNMLFSLLPQLSLANGFHSEWVGKAAVCIAGAILLFCIAYGIKRTGKKLPLRLLIGFLLASYLLLFLRQFIELLQILFGMQIIPLTMWALDMLTPFINHKYLFFNLLLIILFLFFCILSIHIFRGFDKASLASTFGNPAEKRKYLARKRTNYRWTYSLWFFLVIIISIIYGNQMSIAQTLTSKPPVQVTDQNGHIRISKEELKEKELYLYHYTFDEGTDVRFLIVRKMNDNFGVALDACEICGVAGYYQKNHQIICKKCESVVNMTTIGFKGGCNPIPLKYESNDGGFLDINVSEFEKAKKIFQ